MINYVFDVDGTLTPSRQKMDKDFKPFFLNFVKNNTVYLITGSDYAKTYAQLGDKICNSVREIHNCSGNSIWKKGIEIESSDWVLPKAIQNWLNNQVVENKFFHKTGLHIDHRPGLVNFSIVGRNCNLEQRAAYVEWDYHTGDRLQIASAFNERFVGAGVVAQIAGETGLDIAPIGLDKRQLADRLSGPIYFFGDSMDWGGNDFPLKAAIKDRPGSEAFHVKDWQDTQRILWAIENSDVHRFAGVV